ncbi:sigma-70 family RNA polymerase sigma factor [Aneurinibacillus uraniidurans]|uniref:sigma-70 family RNA polymerase sigma factor n=1 Tax=Aneurinibacillus uraniidurans TaxID=2966586 RepID=UPI00234A6362|nr:sigma-70 family RNA polymerase sigma factor [Aneurinibacillus sp. B1]WCN36815.1 sigma-70 family RNA polymerase sigma factor [Aneurinibacillus sp. B1]
MDTDFYEYNVIQAQQGDREAFVRLIKQCETSIYKIARSILKSDTECLDAAQEAVMKAYASIRSVREPKFFKTWLIRIVMNECQRIIRQKKRVIPMEEIIEQQACSTFEGDMALQDAVQALEDDLRIVIMLYYFEDLSVKEMARLLEIPEGTVKSRLTRARTKLAVSYTVEKKEGRLCHE